MNFSKKTNLFYHEIETMWCFRKWVQENAWRGVVFRLCGGSLCTMVEKWYNYSTGIYDTMPCTPLLKNRYLSSQHFWFTCSFYVLLTKGRILRLHFFSLLAALRSFDCNSRDFKLAAAGWKSIRKKLISGSIFLRDTYISGIGQKKLKLTILPL